MLKVRLVALGFALAAALAPATRAQGGPTPVSPQERHAVIAELAQLFNDHYVLPEVARTMGAALVAKEKAGAYDALSDPLAFADAVTNDLKELGHDRHLRLSLKPPPPPGAPPAGPPEDPTAEREEARVNNYGFREVRMLPGNIGYLRLDSFLPTPVAGRTAVAAMGFLSGADAIVFDLRNNGGGSPTMIQLLSSYLFDEPTHLNDIYRREGDRRDQFWTLPWIDGERRPAIPVYVLTSARTFSAAEEFTNNLKVLKRATIVGETTAGGANPGRTFDVGRFEAGISTGRSINPTTGTNWEGTGVEPDVKVPAADALLTAQSAALDALEAKAKAPDAKARYRFARLAIDGQLHPYTLPAGRAADYAGVFGPRRITAEGENLSYQREGGARLRMKPLAADLFALETVDDAMVRFDRDGSGNVVQLVMLYVGGESVENPRTP